MDGYKHFGYLIEDSSQEFFQKTAEEIAKQAGGSTGTIKSILASMKKIEPKGAVAKQRTAASQATKLAMLIYKSNHHDLVKQATDMLFDPDQLNSYEDILNGIAASAFWEPLGMTKSAFDYLNALESINIDPDALDKLAWFIIEDSVGADLVMEAVIEKNAGDQRSLAEIQDELVKISFPGLRILSRLVSGASRGAAAVGAGSKFIGSGAAKGIARSAKGSASAVSNVGKKIFKPGKFQRAGEAIKSRGFKDIAKAPFSGASSTVSGKVRGLNAARGERAADAAHQGIRSLQAKEKALRAQQVGASTSKRVELDSKIKNITSRKSNMVDRARKINSKQRQRMDEAGQRIKRQNKSSASEGARKAKDAADPPKGGKAPDDWTKKQQDLLARGSSKERPARPKREYETKPTSGKAPASPPAGAKEELARKAKEQPGTYGELYKKWTGGGWGALSDAEKRKVYTAAGGAFVAQRAVMDRPII